MSFRLTPNCAASRRTRPDAACTSSPPAGGPTCWWWARAAATRTTGPSSGTTRERCWRTRRARSRSRRLNLPLVPAPSKRSGSASTDRFTANGRSRWPGDWPPSDRRLSSFEAVPVPVYARDPWNVKGEVEEHVEAARQRVAALGHLEPEAGVGDPVHELARYGQSVDLLVIGGHDYRPIDHLLEQPRRSGWPMRSRRRCSCLRLQRRLDAGEELSSTHAHRLHPGRTGRRGVGHLRADAGRPGRRAGCPVRSDTRCNGRRACLLLDWQRLRRLPGWRSPAASRCIGGGGEPRRWPWRSARWAPR